VKNSRRLLYIGMVVGVLVYAMNRYVQTGSISASWSGTITTLLAVFPWVLLSMVNFVFILRGTQKFMGIMLLWATLGIWLSELLSSLNTLGIWIDEIVTATFPITDLMFVVFIGFFLIGVIDAIARGR